MRAWPCWNRCRSLRWMLDEQRYATPSDPTAVDICHPICNQSLQRGCNWTRQASPNNHREGKPLHNCCTSGILEDMMTVPLACSLTAWHSAASRLGEGRRQSNCLTRGIICDIQHPSSFEAPFPGCVTIRTAPTEHWRISEISAKCLQLCL